MRLLHDKELRAQPGPLSPQGRAPLGAGTGVQEFQIGHKLREHHLRFPALSPETRPALCTRCMELPSCLCELTAPPLKDGSLPAQTLRSFLRPRVAYGPSLLSQDMGAGLAVVPLMGLLESIAVAKSFGKVSAAHASQVLPRSLTRLPALGLSVLCFDFSQLEFLSTWYMFLL